MSRSSPKANELLAQFKGEFSLCENSPLNCASSSFAFGLMFYNARWYDPYLNQFIQPDTIIPQPGNSGDWNRYAYVLYNPVNFNDPSGHTVTQVEEYLEATYGSGWEDVKEKWQNSGFWDIITKAKDGDYLSYSDQDGNITHFSIHFYDGDLIGLIQLFPDLTSTYLRTEDIDGYVTSALYGGCGLGVWGVSRQNKAYELGSIGNISINLYKMSAFEIGVERYGEYASQETGAFWVSAVFNSDVSWGVFAAFTAINTYLEIKGNRTLGVENDVCVQITQKMDMLADLKAGGGYYSGWKGIFQRGSLREDTLETEWIINYNDLWD